MTASTVNSRRIAAAVYTLVARTIETAAASPDWSGRVQLAPGFADDAALRVVAALDGEL